MTIKEIIDGLKFTVDMFLFDASTGETFTEPRNDMDKTTIDACKGAIELLEQEPCDDCISRVYIEPIVEELENICVNGDEHILDLLADIKNAPPVTPQPKMGRWIAHPKDIYAHLVCDKCLSNAPYDCRTNYCPNCGAKMTESEVEE